ncbi:MAG: metalloregulator ArsR/SmtB family transcription factor [Actinomycetota bacterium]|nr:metalloregulator ArsR/SmtB family transcription factor [Actinomycetota bacterium]
MREPAVADVFAALGNGTRLALLRYVLHEEHCVSQCTVHVGLTQGAVSKQLVALADAGLLSQRRSSRRIYYRVSDPDAISRLIAVAEALAEKAPIMVAVRR